MGRKVWEGGRVTAQLGSFCPFSATTHWHTHSRTLSHTLRVVQTLKERNSSWPQCHVSDRSSWHMFDLRENPPHTALMKHRRCLLAHLSSLYRREIGVQIHFCFTDGHCVGGIAKIYHNMLLKSSASGVHTLMTANPSEAISWNCITLKQWVTVGGALLSSTARVAALMWCVPVMETHFLCGTSGWVRRPKTTSAGESRPTSSLSTSWLQPRISPGGRQSHGWVGVHSHFLGFWLMFWMFVCRANNVKLQPITFT